MRDINLQRKLILAGLAILLAGDVTLAYLSSRLSTAREIPVEQMLATQNRQVALMREDIRKAAEIRKGIPDVMKQFDQIETSLPPASKGYSVVTQEIEDIVKETHVVVEDNRFHEKDLGGRNLSELEFEPTISGDYSGIVRFLNKLQRSKNMYIVDSLELDSGNSAQTANAPLKVKLHLRTFFRKA